MRAQLPTFGSMCDTVQEAPCPAYFSGFPALTRKAINVQDTEWLQDQD